MEGRRGEMREEREKKREKQNHVKFDPQTKEIKTPDICLEVHWLGGPLLYLFIL